MSGIFPLVHLQTSLSFLVPVDRVIMITMIIITVTTTAIMMMMMITNFPQRPRNLILSWVRVLRTSAIFNAKYLMHEIHLTNIVQRNKQVENTKNNSFVLSSLLLFYLGFYYLVLSASKFSNFQSWKLPMNYYVVTSKLLPQE